MSCSLSSLMGVRGLLQGLYRRGTRSLNSRSDGVMSLT